MDQLKRTKENFYFRVKKIPVRITEQQSKYWINKDLMLHPFLRIFTLTSSVMEFNDESIIFYLNNQGIKTTAKSSSEVVKLRPPKLLSTVNGWMQVCVSVSSSPPLTLLHTHLPTFFSMLPSDNKENTKKTGKTKPSPWCFPCFVTIHRRSRSDTCKAKCSALAARHQKLSLPIYIYTS